MPARLVRPRRTPLIVSAVVLALLSPFAAALLRDAPARAASATWQSGVYRGACGTSAQRAFGTWRGSSIERVTDFLPSTDWNSIAHPDWATGCYKSLSVPVTWSVAMVPDNGATVETGATGSYDGYWRSLASTLVANGQENATLRIGWEMNGTWFRWSAVNRTTAWKDYWRHIVTAMRSVSGAKFTFDWAPGSGQGASGFDVASAYPGDGYVDYVGSSFYDALWGKSDAVPADIWSHARDQAYGLKWQASFASSHGKKISFPEWGLTAPENWGGGGGGDDPYFISHFYDWLDSHDVAYETYFETNVGANKHEMLADLNGNSYNYPKAAAKYKALFGGSTTPAPAPAPTAGDPDETPDGASKDTLLWSTTSDRSDPDALVNGTLRDDAYIYLVPSKAADSVSYYLDDADRSADPSIVEYTSPFDFAGTSSGGAVPWSPDGLSKGGHTMTALIEYSDGTSRSTTAQFWH